MPDHDSRPGRRVARERAQYDDTALIYATRPPRGRHAAADRFKDASPGDPAIDAVREYVRRFESAGAKVSRLFPGESAEVPHGKGRDFASSKPGRERVELSSIHSVRLADAGHVTWLEEELGRDPDVRYVHRPAILYAPALSPSRSVAPLSKAGAPLQRQWGLRQCGFHEVWDPIDTREDPQAPPPLPIGVIDIGGRTEHPDIQGRVEHVPPPGSIGSNSNHAAAVAAVMSAIRGNGDETGMAGCCSATARIFNVWTTKRFDWEAYYQALAAVARDRLPVLNVSMTSFASDPTADGLIQKCIDSEVVVVAAMGDYGQSDNRVAYPAANPDVIAVGGSDRFDRRTRGSSIGSHIWISAPGEDIWTVKDKRHYWEQDGTSFATAMVSAAVWLARRVNPDLSPTQIREVLSKSVDGKSVAEGKHSMELGYGRLDVRKLVELVARK